MRTLLLLIALVTPAIAGWRAECRSVARTCRHNRGTTTTTIPVISCSSPNCHTTCVLINGIEYITVADALIGACSIPTTP